jgi:RNA polymerase sigma-70 factor, ECF subfamily
VTGPATGDAAESLAEMLDEREHLLETALWMFSSEARHERVRCHFARACMAGDVAALRATLAADAVAVSDGGGKVRAASRPLHGADEVARFVSALLSRTAGTVLTAESVNGRTGLVLRRGGEAVAVVSLSVAGTRITAVWIVLNPDKLTRWHQQLPPERRDR